MSGVKGLQKRFPSHPWLETSSFERLYLWYLMGDLTRGFSPVNLHIELFSVLNATIYSIIFKRCKNFDLMTQTTWTCGVISWSGHLVTMLPILPHIYNVELLHWNAMLQARDHLRSPRLLCVRSLGSPWYDFVYFNSASSSIQCVVSLLQRLTKLSVLNVSHYATMNNKISVKLNWRCFKNRSMIGRIESVRVQSD